MDYEDFLVELYTPLKAIKFLSDVIYDKANNDWEFNSQNANRENFDELIATNFLIGLTAKYLIDFRKKQIENIKY